MAIPAFRTAPRRRAVRLERDRLLLTWSSDTPRFNDLLEPVIAEFDPGRCNVVGKPPSVRSRLDKAIGYCTVDQAMNVGVNRGVAPGVWLLSCRLAPSYQAVA